MMRTLPLLLAAASLVACSSARPQDPAPGQVAGSPCALRNDSEEPAGPTAAHPRAAVPPAPAEAPPAVGAEAGLRAPGFRFPSLGGGAAISLEEAVAAQKGSPLVLVLGDASCSVSTREMEDLAGEGALGPGSGETAFLAVVRGMPGEVAGIVPPGTRFPILVDEEGGILDRYRVMATPSIVVLDGKGRIAYIGDGGYLPPAQVREMAARTARGEAIDASKIQPEGG